VSQLPQKGAQLPQFSVHVYCGQTDGWMNTPLGMEADLGPGHIVLDGVPALREQGTAVPLFSAHVYCGHGRPSQLLLSCCLYSSPFIEPPKFYALQCFSIGTTPPKCPFTWGIYAPCNTCVLKPPDSALQTVSRSVQPFYTAHGRESLSALKCD